MKKIAVIFCLIICVGVTGCFRRNEPKVAFEKKVETPDPRLVVVTPKTMDMLGGQNNLFQKQSPVFAVEPQVSSVPPAERGGVRFDSAVKVNGKLLQLRGTTVRKFEISALSLITIYTVGFYAPTGINFGNDIPDGEKVLVLEYHLDVDKQKVIESIKNNVYSNPKVNAEVVRPYFEQLSNAFDSPRKGDRYQFSYVPGRGTAMMKDGKVLTIVPTVDFEKAFFGIWLSPHGKDLKMRCELLALPCPEKSSLNPVSLISSNLSGAKDKLSKLKNLVS